jgi:hypothetical protein
VGAGVGERSVVGVGAGVDVALGSAVGTLVGTELGTFVGVSVAGTDVAVLVGGTAVAVAVEVDVGGWWMARSSCLARVTRCQVCRLNALCMVVAVAAGAVP